MKTLQFAFANPMETLRACSWTVRFRAGLALFGSGVVLESAARGARNATGVCAEETRVRTALRAAEIAARVVPGTRCLVKALTAQALLARAGVATEVFAGVRRRNDRMLEAHAWLERDGEVLIGGDPSGYAFLGCLTRTFPAV
jgi:hypothetical protein